MASLTLSDLHRLHSCGHRLPDNTSDFGWAQIPVPKYIQEKCSTAYYLLLGLIFLLAKRSKVSVIFFFFLTGICYFFKHNEEVI